MITPSAKGSLHLTTAVELDANLLGFEIASEEDSGEQARLFAGLAAGFESLGTVDGPMQIAYVVDELRKLSPASARQVFTMFETLLAL